MNVIVSGYEYEVVTNDLTTHPTGLQTIQFEKTLGANQSDGITDTLEMILVLLDRLEYLSEYEEDDTVTPNCDYSLAYKAQNLSHEYTDRQE